MKHRILICGGRKYGIADLSVKPEEFAEASHNALVEREYLKTALDNLKEKIEIEVLIEGGAKGADTLAGQWADQNKVPRKTFPVTKADWKLYGKAAGMIRNQAMLDEGKPTLVIAFPGGPGTKDMVERAKKAGLPVFEFSYEVLE